MDLPLILLGAGGHAKVLLAILLEQNKNILGITDPSRSQGKLYGVPILGNDEIVLTYEREKIYLVNGLGSTNNTRLRQEVFEKFKLQGFKFASVIHHSAVILPEVVYGEGIQVLPGAVIQPSTLIGKNVLINTRVIVGHDCYIGDHVHLAPGSILSGGVSIAEHTHVGTGAVILQNRRVGEKCLIGADAFIVRDIPAGSTVVGEPGRMVESICSIK